MLETGTKAEFQLSAVCSSVESINIRMCPPLVGPVILTVSPKVLSLIFSALLMGFQMWMCPHFFFSFFIPSAIFVLIESCRL